ncbi:MAG: acetate/propionate family kinase [Syntrophobacteraceae bacterium]|nr:acetate/propionate family kinase [Syntrophobacteraceae bacterium]
MDDAIIVLNAGSSSLKFSVFIPEEEVLHLLFKGQISGLFVEARFQAFREGAVFASKSWPKSEKIGHREAIEFLFQWGAGGPMQGHRAAAVGHRVVHGGSEFTKAVKIDRDVISKLEKLAILAPLHQPYNLAAIRASAEYRPDLLQVACFDTSFHQTAPRVAQAFALPRVYTEAGIRRYGFHGISYEYIASMLPKIDPVAARGRTIIAHLGNGASMCAVQAGRSIASTTGFSAADGLPMGTRCGSLDPGVLIYLMDNYGLDAKGLNDLINNQSGLLGVSGISSDMRELLASNDSRASEAVDLFVYRIAREMGSLAAALGGLDSVVFTGGVGENAAAIRSRVCKGSGWLGIRLNEEANSRGGPKISSPQSPVSVWVIATNEELMIAGHTLALMQG